MVDVSHYGNDWCTRHEVVLVVLHLCDGFLHFCADIFCLEAELLSYEVDGLGVEALVD